MPPSEKSPGSRRGWPQKHLRALNKILVPQGAELRETKSHMAIVRTSDGQRLGTIAKTTSDQRAILNQKSQLRRLGFDVPR